MPIGIGIGVAGIGGAMISSRSAKKSAAAGAGASVEATRLGVEEQKRQFDIARETLSPFIGAGRGALDLLSDPDALLRNVRSNPAFQFQMEQGLQAIGRSGAARGFRNSGNIMMGLQEFGQGLASDFFNQEFARQFGLAQLGQSSAGALSGASIQSGNTLAGLYSNQGRTLANLQSNLGAQRTTSIGNALSAVGLGAGIYFGMR